MAFKTTISGNVKQRHWLKTRIDTITKHACKLNRDLDFRFERAFYISYRVLQLLRFKKYHEKAAAIAATAVILAGWSLRKGLIICDVQSRTSSLTTNLELSVLLVLKNKETNALLVNLNAQSFRFITQERKVDAFARSESYDIYSLKLSTQGSSNSSTYAVHSHKLPRFLL